MMERKVFATKTRKAEKPNARPVGKMWRSIDDQLVDGDEKIQPAMKTAQLSALRPF